MCEELRLKLLAGEDATGARDARWASPPVTRFRPPPVRLDPQPPLAAMDNRCGLLATRYVRCTDVRRRYMRETVFRSNLPPGKVAPAVWGCLQYGHGPIAHRHRRQLCERKRQATTNKSMIRKPTRTMLRKPARLCCASKMDAHGQQRCEMGSPCTIGREVIPAAWRAGVHLALALSCLSSAPTFRDF